jgi:hypothetical protein
MDDSGKNQAAPEDEEGSAATDEKFLKAIT